MALFFLHVLGQGWSCCQIVGLQRVARDSAPWRRDALGFAQPDVESGHRGGGGGLHGLEQGTGLDIVPGVFGETGKSHATSSTALTSDPSLEVYYKITPALTGSFTVNTDFSATEVDDRQVNLTRFNLLFPENATSS